MTSHRNRSQRTSQWRVAGWHPSGHSGHLIRMCKAWQCTSVARVRGDFCRDSGRGKTGRPDLWINGGRVCGTPIARGLEEGWARFAYSRDRRCRRRQLRLSTCYGSRAVGRGGPGLRPTPLISVMLSKRRRQVRFRLPLIPPIIRSVRWPGFWNSPGRLGGSSTAMCTSAKVLTQRQDRPARVIDLRGRIPLLGFGSNASAS